MFVRLIVSVLAATAPEANAPPASPPALPAEEQRLSTAAFRAGLKKRGLTALLELHLRDYPPTSETERLLMLRDIKMMEYADATRPRAERSAAVREADRILESLLEDAEDDPRRFSWRMSLARSLLYDETEPQLTNLLYRVIGDRDRARLQTVTTRAVRTLRKQLEDLAREDRRIETLTARQFERLEEEGYIETIDRLGPESRYLLLWALLYDAAARRTDDPLRTAQLHEIVDRLHDDPSFLNIPHHTSGVQVQTWLLSGMAHRLLNDHPEARDRLRRALDIAGGIQNRNERQRIAWAVTLAHLEQIRNEAQANRFEVALQNLQTFREAIDREPGDSFESSWSAALAERFVYRLQAESLRRSGREEEAREAQRNAWKAIVRLVAAHPEHRDEVYAVLYDALPPDVEPDRLDPVERSALVAGLLYDADQNPDRAEALLQRCIKTAEAFVADPNAPPQIVPEVMYNLAVAYVRSGDEAAAADRFLRIAREHSDFPDAARAARLAVRLASHLYEERPESARAKRRYRDALRTLLERYPKSDAARTWRFYYAQFLDESGDYERAARQYALVAPDHPFHLESLFFRARCLALLLQDESAAEKPDAGLIENRLGTLLDLLRRFRRLASRERDKLDDLERKTLLADLLARAPILEAEVEVLPTVDRPDHALRALEDFETAFPDHRKLMARVWRARLIAYRRLGRLDDAARALPAYLATDPQDALPTLQTLYDTLAAEIDRCEREKDAPCGEADAALALLLARQIHQWVEDPGHHEPAPRRRAASIQLAEAFLRAGKAGDARAVFESLAHRSEGGRPAEASADRLEPRVDMGLAESLYRLGELRKALPRFNRLARRLPPSDPLRWRALLRDLQCRIALNEPPETIIKVIDQQERLFPELGGADLAAEFHKLRRTAERKLSEGP